MIRQTKIIGTLGPSSCSSEMIQAMMDAGVDLVRHNLSHSTIEEHCRIAQLVASLSDGKRTIGQIFDLQGPKLRIASFKKGSVVLKVGQEFILDAECASHEGNQHKVGIAYKALPQLLGANNNLLLDDGKIKLQVIKTSDTTVKCRVVDGGVLTDRKGINLVGGGLAAPALTDADKEQIDIAVQCVDPDYFAISFVENAADVLEARARVEAAGGHAGIIAKIERKQALDNLDEIIEVSDAVMIARGDLGVEIGDALLPAVQRRILKRARELNTPLITATQMMESMIESPVPTRAEVFDVANAVVGGTDAVMLSAETAQGKYPDKVIAKISEICQEAEMQPESRIIPSIDAQFSRVDQTIAMAAMYAATHSQIRAVLAFTESGNTSLWMSRVTSCTDLPIYALTPYKETKGRVMLYRSVHPIDISVNSNDYGECTKRALARLLDDDLVDMQDTILLTKGSIQQVGGTNSMEIFKVSDMLGKSDGEYS